MVCGLWPGARRVHPGTPYPSSQVAPAPSSPGSPPSSSGWEESPCRSGTVCWKTAISPTEHQWILKHAQTLTQNFNGTHWSYLLLRRFIWFWLGYGCRKKESSLQSLFTIFSSKLNSMQRSAEALSSYCCGWWSSVTPLGFCWVEEVEDNWSTCSSTAWWAHLLTP